jgi:hypothetical protein
LERDNEIPVKDCKKPMKNKEKVVVQEKKHKGKGFEKTNETCKETPIQMEEKDENNPVETAHVSNPLGNQTYKRLIKQLRDARREISHLKEEYMVHLAQMNELTTGYNCTLDLARFTARKDLPLRKQLKNIYRQNRGFQAQNMKLKEELNHFQDEVTKKNLQVLVESAIEYEKPISKESTTILKKPTRAKKKKSTEFVEDTLSTRKSVRLSVKMKKYLVVVNPIFESCSFLVRLNDMHILSFSTYIGF